MRSLWRAVHRSVPILLLGSLLPAAALCGGDRWSGSTAPLRSQVVDGRTGEPIAGAVALGVWHKFAGLPGLTHHELVGVQEVEADAAGRFELRPPKGWYGEDNESITVYKFGYVAWNNLFIYPNSVRRPDSTIPARIALEPFPAGASREQHEYFISNSIRGGFGRERAPKFWDAIRQERERR